MWDGQIYVCILKNLRFRRKRVAGSVRGEAKDRIECTVERFCYKGKRQEDEELTSLDVLELITDVDVLFLVST